MQAPFGLLSEFARHADRARLRDPPRVGRRFPNKVRPATGVWCPSVRIVGGGRPATLPDRVPHSPSSPCAHSQHCAQSPAREKVWGTPSFPGTPSWPDAVPRRPGSGLESLLFYYRVAGGRTGGVKQIQTRRPRSLQQAKGGPRNTCLGRNAVKNIREGPQLSYLAEQRGKVPRNQIRRGAQPRAAVHLAAHGVFRNSAA